MPAQRIAYVSGSSKHLRSAMFRLMGRRVWTAVDSGPALTAASLTTRRTAVTLAIRPPGAISSRDRCMLAGFRRQYYLSRNRGTCSQDATSRNYLHSESSCGGKRRLSTAEEGANSMSLFGPRPESWWTGIQPRDAPGMLPSGQLSSLPQLILSPRVCTKQALLDYFDNTWVLTDTLFASLQGEQAFLHRPAHGLRHPLIFYYGHAAALYVNKLRAAGILEAPLNAYFEALLETGVDEMSWDDVGDENMTWPSVEEVHAYRCDVYNLVRFVITSAPNEAIANISANSPYCALPMAFEHERIHVETSSVLIRELPLEYVSRPAAWPEDYPFRRDPSAAPENPLVHVKAGEVTLGKPTDFPSYGWDNEYGSRTYSVPAFEASKHMVSNGEFLHFVKDAGYARRELWTESGWGWKMFRNVKHPIFWIQQGPSGFHEYRLRTLFDEVPLPEGCPVIVNFHEAKAFAAWKTSQEQQAMGDLGRAYRLTTELEHRLIRGTEALPAKTDRPEAVDPVLATSTSSSSSRTSAFDGMVNANLAFGSESPVGMLPPNDRGFHDVVGNAWEWCEDHLSALPGFSINPLYEDFSTPCFDGKHNIIMGGSFASTGNEASVFARFHFRPHFHQHAGFRLVAPARREEAQSFITSCTDAPAPFVGSYPFRTSATAASSTDAEVARRLSEYRDLAANMAMHFAAPAIAQQDSLVARGLRYPQRCAQILLDALGGQDLAHVQVVEVGCGAGGGSFELSKHAGRVIALDPSKALVEVASAIATGAEITLDTSRLEIPQEALLDGDASPSKITFGQCDPMCLPAGLAGLDAALIHSMMDVVPSPNTLLGRMGGARGLVKHDGGLVVLVSAYNWNDDITPRGAQLRGHPHDHGHMVSPVQGLAKALGEDFKLVHSEQVPLMVPLIDRTFKYASAEATVWRRN